MHVNRLQVFLVTAFGIFFVWALLFGGTAQQAVWSGALLAIVIYTVLDPGFTAVKDNKGVVVLVVAIFLSILSFGFEWGWKWTTIFLLIALGAVITLGGWWGSILTSCGSLLLKAAKGYQEMVFSSMMAFLLNVGAFLLVSGLVLVIGDVSVGSLEEGGPGLLLGALGFVMIMCGVFLAMAYPAQKMALRTERLARRRRGT